MSKRLTWGEDGCLAYKVTTSFATGNQTALSAGEKGILNGDASQSAQYVQLISSANLFSGLLFKLSKAAVIERLFVSFHYNSVTSTPATTLLVEASGDSTDGSDGTWTTLFTESHTIRLAASDSRLFLQAQTVDEETVTYTWIRVSWSGHASLNNLRVMSLWLYAEYSSPPYDFYDAQGLAKVQIGEVLLGAFAGNAAVARAVRFKIKNTDSQNRTYTLPFGKVKVTADATFLLNIGLNTDGTSTVNSSVQLTVAVGDMADFYVAINIPANGEANGNLQDGLVHYGKITVAATGGTVLPGFMVAVYYDTLANIEILQGTGLVNICLVYQRDNTDEGPIAAWSWWDVYGIASCVQQEAVGNDIVLLLDSSGYLWEMDRNEYDNEEFAPSPVLMILKTVELPAKADPHIWRRSMYFDFDIEGADGGVMADYLLTAIKDTGKVVTETNNIHLASLGMRLSTLDVGFQFQHELRVLTGGKLSIKNYGFVYQDLLVERARWPYVA